MSFYFPLLKHILRKKYFHMQLKLQRHHWLWLTTTCRSRPTIMVRRRKGGWISLSCEKRWRRMELAAMWRGWGWIFRLINPPQHCFHVVICDPGSFPLIFYRHYVVFHSFGMTMGNLFCSFPLTESVTPVISFTTPSLICYSVIIVSTSLI